MDTETKIAGVGRVRRKLHVLLALLAVPFADSVAMWARTLPPEAQPREASVLSPQAPAAAQFTDVARLVVMIEATLDGTPSQGAGVVFAVKENIAFVLTANHVVRSTAVAKNIRAFFSASPDLPAVANVRPEYSPDLDLAVLEVDVSTIDLQSQKLLPFELLMGDSSQMKRGDPVFPIGYPEGLKWSSPLLAPDRFDHADKQHFFFQSHNVKVGYSGGAVCSADWRVVGIVLAVAEAPVVLALPIEIVRQQVKDWGFVVGTASAESPLPPATVPAPAKTEDVSKQAEGGLKEGQTTNGAVYRTFSPWGGFSDSDPTWTEIVAQKIQGIPPLKTWFGNTPDFALVLSQPSGEVWSVRLSKRCVFPPTREEDAEGALVRVTQSGWFSNSDVTFPGEAVTFPKVRQGQLLKLHYVDRVMQEVRNLTDSAEVTMFVQAIQFLPDANSGDNKDPATAEVVSPGMLKDDAVSFNDGNATHHFVLNPLGGSCKGILWIEPTGNVGLTSTARRVNEGSVSLLLEGPSTPKVKLYEVRCEGKKTIIRMQAETPGSFAHYHIFVRSDSNEGIPRLQGPLVQAWIASWVASMKETFEFRKVTESEWNAIDRGLGIIRQYTAGTPEDFITALNEAIDEGTGESPEDISEGYWRLLEALVSRHLDEISRATPQCCEKAVKVRFVASLLRAEANLPYDHPALDWATTQTNLPEPLRTRVTKVKSPKPPQ